MHRSFSRHSILACYLTATLSLFAGQPGPDTSKPDQSAAIKALIQKLNAPDNIAREDAERELLKVGQVAIPALKEASKSPEPEIAARAKRLVGKMTEMTAKPAQSYAEVFPSDTIFFLEAPHTRETLDKMKQSPLGKFWDLAATQKFYKGHHEAQVPNDQKLLDAARAIPKLLDGRAIFALGSPDTAEAAELDPPLVYVFETKQGQALEAQVRALFEGMTDPAKANRRYGPFTIEEHITAQSVYGQESIIHSLTQKGMESFLDNLLKRPEKQLATDLKDIRALQPNPDFIYHLSADGFADLADAGQLIDDQQFETLETIGFVTGSRWQGAISMGPDGCTDDFRLTIGGAEKNEGLAAVFKKMAAEMPEPVAAGKPSALDLIPWQAGLVVSFNGDTAKNATALTKAITALDSMFAPAPPQPVQPRALPVNANPNQPVVPPAQPGPQPIPGKQVPPPPPAAPADNAAVKGNTIGQKVMAAAGGADDKPKADKKEEKKPKPVVVPPHVAKFEKIGLKLEQFLEQIDGPVQLGLFMQQIEEDVPDDMPVSPLYAVRLKDVKIIEQALEAAAVGEKPRFLKEVLNGGVHYIETDGDEEQKPGFWLKGNYFAYSTERDLLDLAGAALAHQAGNERYSDRANYQQAVAQKKLTGTSLFTIFGDAEQVLEMPYKLAKLNWQEDDDNPWPAYDWIRPLVKGKPVLIDFKAAPDGIHCHAETPLSLMGMIEIFRRSFIEAGYY
jgi:hypothetical protein